MKNANYLRALFRYGQALAPPVTEQISSAYLWDVTADTFVYVENVYDVPRTVTRGSNIKPNRGYDNLKYIAIESAKRDTWWRQLVDDLRTIDPKWAAEVESAWVRVRDWKLTQLDIGADKPGPRFWKIKNVRVVGGPKRAPEGAVSDGVWILPCLPGKSDPEPIVSHAKFKSWWSDVLAPRGGSRADIVTGLPCEPVQLHASVARVPGTGGKATLMSYNNASFEFENLKQGDNSPMAAETSRLIATGLDRLLESEETSLQIRDVGEAFVIWPRDGIAHPLAAPVMNILGAFIKYEERTARGQELWSALEKADDSGYLNLLWLAGSQKRVNVRCYEEISAADLKRNMYIFRKEFSAFYYDFEYPLLRPILNTLSVKQQPPTVWGVLTGAKFPAQIGFELHRPAFGNRWSRPFLAHNKGMIMPEISKPVIRTYNDHHVMVSMPPQEEYIKPDLESREEYIFGVLLAAAGGVKRVYHMFTENSKAKADPGAILGIGINSPRVWLGTYVQRFQREYMLRVEQRGKYRIFQEVFQDYLARLGAWFPAYLTADQKPLVNMGFNDFNRFTQDFFDFHRGKNQEALAAMEKEGLLSE